MPSPAFDAPPAASDEPSPAANWSDCPRCGEHWPANSPYCSNCGWSPEPAAPQHPGTSLAQQALRGPWPAIALGAVALGALAWAWLAQRPTSPVAPAAPIAAASVPTPVAVPPVLPASQPPAVQASAPPAAQASQPLVAAPPVAQAESAAPSLAAEAEPPEIIAARFAREWLAAESASGAGPDHADRSRPLYAEQVDYRGRPGAHWGDIAADKAELARRWPLRHYELLAVRDAVLEPDGLLRTRLQLRWRLENQGRWRAGEATAVLQLRRVDGLWRIVAEGGR